MDENVLVAVMQERNRRSNACGDWRCTVLATSHILVNSNRIFSGTLEVKEFLWEKFRSRRFL